MYKVEAYKIRHTELFKNIDDDKQTQTSVYSHNPTLYFPLKPQIS